MENENEKTLTITELKKDTNGFVVVVGHKKGCGTFKYIIGTKKEAKKLGEEIRETEMKLFSRKRKLFVDIKPINLKKCNICYCKNLCEDNEPYCLRCDTLLFDAQQEAREQEIIENEVLRN